MNRAAIAIACSAAVLFVNGAVADDLEQIYQQGVKAQAGGDYDLAFSCFNAVLGKDSANVRSLNGHGWTYFLKKDYGKAIKDYDEIVRLLPKETFGYGNRANVYLYGKKDYDKAIADYSEVLRLAPDKFPDGHLKRGLSYHAQKEYDKAIEDFDRAIKLSPDYAEAYHSRGLAYFAKSAYREALGDYYKAKTLILKRTNAKLIRSITSGDPTETVRRTQRRRKITATWLGFWRLARMRRFVSS